MKNILRLMAVLIVLAAWAAPQVLEPSPSPANTPQAFVPTPAPANTPPAALPNPASVYCVQKGNRHEIPIAADGSQGGVCVFPDGKSCDEWAYYRGECGPGAQSSPTPTITVAPTATPSGGGTGGNLPGSLVTPETTEKITDWWGTIKSTPPGAQYDDYFERRDLAQIIYFGVDSMDPAVKSQIKALRDSGTVVRLYGTLLSNVPDYNGSQIQVDRIEVVGYLLGSSVTPGTAEKIANWWGVIKSNPPGAQFDDCFQRQDLGQTISFGIDSTDSAIRSQIKTLRDTGKIVHLYGTLSSNVPDCNGSQIQVERIEVDK